MKYSVIVMEPDIHQISAKNMDDAIVKSRSLLNAISKERSFLSTDSDGELVEFHPFISMIMKGDALEEVGDKCA